MGFLKAICATALMLAVIGCGGGSSGEAGTSPFGSGAGTGTGTGGTGGTGGSSATVPAIAVSLASTTVTVAAPVRVTAKLTDASGAAVAGQVVAFSTPGDLGTLSPPTALTDAAGVASVQLIPKAATTSGADKVVASAMVNTVAVTGSQGFTVVPTSAPVGTPSLGVALSTTTVTTTTPATVTAAIKDANGAAVVGQVVAFSSPAGRGLFSPPSALTDANGNAIVTLSPATTTTTGADSVVASATISGTALTVSQGFQVAITNADLILSVSANQIPNTGSGAVSVVATAIDSNRNTVAGVPVTLSADGGAVLSGAGLATGPNGNVTASLAIGTNRANRLVTITATAGSVVRTATVQVVGTSINATLVPAVVAPSGQGSVQYRVLDQAGAPMSNQAVQIVATGMAPSQAVGATGSNGDFAFSFTAPATIGSYTITANIAGKTDIQTVLVQSIGSIPPADPGVGGIASIAASVSANPSVVSANILGSSTNQSQIRALFLGANNLPIPNVRAKFDLNGDANSIGGSFSTGSAILYSDANGVVTSSYVPGTRSSPTDGLTVRVCYGLSDTDPNLLNCASTKTATLTVTAEPLGVSIGTNEAIIVNSLTYIKQFIVTVSDAAGVAKPDVNLAVSLDLTNYRKGHYVGPPWAKAGPLASGDAAVCANEDANRNGVLDPGDDVNADGMLWPRKPDVVVSLLQSKTAADGTAILQIQYAKDHGSWVDALITVSASGVSGSEGRVSYLLAPVPVDAASLTASTAPAFVVSPYGQATSCSNKN